MVASPKPRAAITTAWTSAPAAFALIALAVTALRIAALAASPVGLHGDEAQYWAWSRTLDWGYYSKPPLIAWAIAGTTALFGNAEWAVRLSAPLAHAAGAGALYLLGRRMFGPLAGLYAGLGWLLMPGIWLSSFVMSTDALLLPLWSLALYAAWRLVETRGSRAGWGHAALLGAAVGLGALAKYAMLYFFLGAALAAVLVPAARRAFVSLEGLAAAAVAAATLAPNLAWNAAHSFATVSHTAANANLQGPLFNPENLLEFWAAQPALLGPFLFAAAAAGTWAAFRGPAGPTRDAQRFLAAFLLPPLVLISAQALISRAHGNWAAAAFPAAVTLGGAMLALATHRLWGWLSVGASAALGIVFTAAVVAAPIADALGLDKPLRRSRGWDATVRAIDAHVAANGPYAAIVVDHRLSYNSLFYEWRAAPPAPLRMWVLRDAPGNQAEAQAPMTVAFEGRVLLVGVQDRYAALVAGDFRTVGPETVLQIPLGGGWDRRLTLRDAAGFAPVPRDAAFLSRIDGEPADGSE